MYGIFGGSGGVAKACHRLGMPGIVIDTVHDKKFDATTFEFRAQFLRHLQLKQIACVHLATPCASFSIAAG